MHKYVMYWWYGNLKPCMKYVGHWFIDLSMVGHSLPGTISYIATPTIYRNKGLGQQLNKDWFSWYKYMYKAEKWNFFLQIIRLKLVENISGSKGWSTGPINIPDAAISLNHISLFMLNWFSIGSTVVIFFHSQVHNTVSHLLIAPCGVMLGRLPWLRLQLKQRLFILYNRTWTNLFYS